MRRISIGVALVLAAPGLAQDHEMATYGPVLDACYAEAGSIAALKECIGQMAERCMDEEVGGHSTLGMSMCAYGESQAWDRHLNVEYKATRAHMKAMDADEADYFPEYAKRVEALLAAQRAWISFRDAECALEYAKWGSGSMRNIAGSYCILEMTADRAIDLKAMREEF